MHCIAEIRIEPLGQGTSIRPTIDRACELLADAGLRHHVHAMGTNLEGDLDMVLAAISRLHEQLHADGVARLASHVEIQTRLDKEVHIEPDDEEPIAFASAP